MKIYQCIIIIACAFTSITTFAQTDSSKTIILKSNVQDKIADPLVIIDGNKQYIRGSAVLNIIDPANIESVSVFKGEKAIQNYGLDGISGVIAVKTKSGMISQITPKDDISIFLKGNNNPLKTPLYILDGYITEESTVKSIKPDNISSISVLNGTKATSLYGITGANGVVIINTKIKSTLNIKQ